MMGPGTAERARERLTGQIERLARLRGTGPNPFDYWIWADETRTVLGQLFGAESDEARVFHDIAHASGRLLEQRGQSDNMTLNLHGDWGIWSRLDRAEPFLRGVLDRLGPAAG
jgi:hypothetical protein